MPYAFELDREARVAYVRGSGEFDVAETLRAPVELARDPAYDPGFGVVVDLREVVYAPRTREVVELARNLVELRDLFRHRIAVVVADPLVLVAELAAAMVGAGGVAVRVFAAPDEAVAWVKPGAEAAAQPDRG